MARIQITKDAVDKSRSGRDPLAIEGLDPGMRGYWVRTKGYDADGHMQEMIDAGYEKVRRMATTEGSGDDPRLKSGQHAQLDGTIKRGDLMLMQCPIETFKQHQAETQEQVEHRVRATLGKLKELGGDGYDRTSRS